MSKPRFFEGVALAVLLAVSGASLLTVLMPLLDSAIAWRLITAVLAATYLLYLLRRSAEPAGRLLIPGLWLLLTVGAWALLGPLGFLVLQTSALWLVRSLYFHASVLPALLDMALSALSLAAALWALGSGSWLLAVWSFFLVQACFVWIPTFRPTASADAAPDGTTQFEMARALAQSALHRLASGR